MVYGRGKQIKLNPSLTRHKTTWFVHVCMMAAGESQATQAFPNPPALYYKLYTDDNVQSGRAPPPPLPVKGVYHMFGAPFDVSLFYFTFIICIYFIHSIIKKRLVANC